MPRGRKNGVSFRPKLTFETLGRNSGLQGKKKKKIFTSQGLQNDEFQGRAWYSKCPHKHLCNGRVDEEWVIMYIHQAGFIGQRREGARGGEEVIDRLGVDLPHSLPTWSSGIVSVTTPPDGLGEVRQRHFDSLSYGAWGDNNSVLWHPGQQWGCP